MQIKKYGYRKNKFKIIFNLYRSVILFFFIIASTNVLAVRSSSWSGIYLGGQLGEGWSHSLHLFGDIVNT